MTDVIKHPPCTRLTKNPDSAVQRGQVTKPRAVATGCRFFLLLSTGITLVSPPAESAEATWPQFRGPHGNGVANETGVPVDIGPHSNVLWKTELPPGHSSPVILDDRIFLTAAHDEEKRLETLCLDRLSGDILWRQTAPTKRYFRGHGTNSAASSSPAVDDTGVYVYFGSYGVVAYDFEGNERWKKNGCRFLSCRGVVGCSPRRCR